MEPPANSEQRLRQTIDATSTRKMDDAAIRGFYQSIDEELFFPQPNRYRPLKITAALNRMPDLTPVARQRLIMAIRARWDGYSPSQENDTASLDGRPADPGLSGSATVPSGTEGGPASESDQLALVAADSDSGAKPGQKDCFSSQRLKRDWFDLLLDGVAACISLFRSSRPTV
jgi:hypothetical protein